MGFKERFQAAVRDGDTTQEAIAEAVGVNRVTVSKWMGKGIFPRADQAVVIARALGVSVEYLVTGQERGADPFVVAEHDLIRDLKELEPDQLAFIRRQVANEAQEARKRRQTASGS